MRDLHDRLKPSLNSPRKVVCAEARDYDFLNDAASDRVREDAFEAISDFNPELAIISYNEQDDAVIKTFFADLPALGYPDTEAFEIFPLQAGNRQHGDLMAGLLLEAGQTLFENLDALRRHDPRVIVDAAAQRRDVKSA